MIGVNRFLDANIGFSSVTYDTDAASYFTRAGITNTTERNAWNTFVVDAKAANIYSKFIAIYPVSPTSIGASYYNAISSSYTLSSSAAPSYSTNGWTSDGVTQFLNTGIIPNTHLTLDNVTVSWRVKTSAVRTGIDWGVTSSTTNQMYGRSRFTSDVIRFMYQSNASVFDSTNATGAANFFMTANSSTSRKIRRNTTSVATSAATHAPSPSQPTHAIYLLGRNNAGTADQFCPINMNFWAVSTALSDAESNTLSGLIDTYSANVISGGR
jgi:hypothetical protein